MERMNHDPAKASTADDRREWVEKWSRKMVEIWHEQLRRQGAVRTGALDRSLASASLQGDADFTTLRIEHEFRLYGLFVDRGSGREMGGERDERGRLLKDVRRKSKPWFSRKYYASSMALKEFLGKTIGEDFAMLMKNVSRQISEWHQKNAHSKYIK